MNIPEIVEILTNSGIDKREAAIEVKMMIEHFCNYSTTDILMGRPLDYEKLKIVKEKAIFRAKTKTPIQYIIGKAYFMGDFYKVNPDVLIPRDETELAVLKAISYINQYGLKNILDIGTGSGCIACSIAKRTNTTVLATDISQSSLEIAASNIDTMDLKNVELLKSDLFSEINNKKFDLIISNPPYIPVGTKLQKEVQFEPKTALFASGDGTGFYKSIIEQSKEYLNQGGFIVFELGIDQSTIVKNYLKENGFKNIVIEKDLAGIDRVISAHL